MSIMTLMNEIGPDADLLTRNDAWLESERYAKAAELDKLAKELRAIQLAQRIKQLLQQRNLVPVQQILRDADGEILDVVIRIMNLPDALPLLSAPRDTLDELNAAGQLSGWHSDGYDLPTAAALR